MKGIIVGVVTVSLVIKELNACPGWSVSMGPDRRGCSKRHSQDTRRHEQHKYHARVTFASSLIYILRTKYTGNMFQCNV